MDLEKLRVRMTSEQINELPLVHYPGPISVVTTPEALEEALPDLETETVLGFDTETKPNFKKGPMNPPALLQLATAVRVYLIQFCHVPFDRRIADILSDPAKVKAGVAIADDMRELCRLAQFEPRGTVDLGDIARRHQIWSQGLRPMAANFFRLRISKSQQCSNWAAAELSQKQVLYAATDAWLGRRLFLAMQDLGLTE